MRGIKQIEAELAMNKRSRSALEIAEQEIAELRQILLDVRKDLEAIVIPDGIDAGVILLSGDSPAPWDEQRQCHVYQYEYFSPLGDALVTLWKKIPEGIQ